MWDSYYIANTLLLALYPAIKYTFSLTPRALYVPDDWLNFFGGDREAQVLSTACLILVARYFKSATWAAFLEYFFMYLKLSFIILLALSSKVATGWYLVAVFVVWVCFRQPEYLGQHNFVEITTFAELIETVLSSDDSWVLLCHASWHSDCISTMSLWASMSVKYTTSKLKFARVDVDEVRGVAQKVVIDTSGMSFQLPSLILYDAGKEVSRFPPVDSTGRVAKVLKYDIRMIVRYLGIEERYMASVHT
jgi:hypothetical protein